MYCSPGVRNTVSTSGVHAAVHTGHLEFVLEIGDGSQAADDDLGALLVDKFAEQGVETDDVDVGDIVQHLLRHFHPFDQAEMRALGRTFGNGRDDALEGAPPAATDPPRVIGSKVPDRSQPCGQAFSSAPAATSDNALPRRPRRTVCQSPAVDFMFRFDVERATFVQYTRQRGVNLPINRLCGADRQNQIELGAGRSQIL